MDREGSILLIHPSLHARATLEAEEFVRFQPLGLAYIAASTPRDWRVEIADESCESPVDFSRHRIVGISTNTRTAPRAYELALRAKEHGCYAVAGGIHASMCHEEALRFFDTVIRGEGERLWSQFLRDFDRGRPKRMYQSSHFEDMNAIPLPDRTVLGDHYPVASIQTSRGCPFNCSFCSVTAFNGKIYRYRDPEGVLKELESIRHRYVFFVDDNLIGCSERSIRRAKTIFRAMIERHLEKRFIAQVTINFGEEEELMDLAYASGCRGVFIGIESLQTDVLKAMNKSINLKVGVRRFKEIFKRINDHGIAVIATITVGNDGEPEGGFQALADFIEESEVDAVQLTIATPLPGTRLFEQLFKQGRIVFDRFPEDWVHYSLGSLVFIPRSRTVASIAREWHELIDRVYARRRLLRRALRTFRHTKSASSAYFAYRLNRAYRESYRHSLFYNSPPLQRFMEAGSASVIG